MSEQESMIIEDQRDEIERQLEELEQMSYQLEQQAEDIKALRKCIIELNNHNPEWLVFDLKAILYEHGLIDEKLKPTKLLTGE